MKKLKLPVVKLVPESGRRLSMDEYLRFVMDNLKYTVDIKTARREKKKMFVNIPFILK